MLLLPIAAGRGGLSCATLPGEELQKMGNEESSDGLGWLGFFWEVSPWLCPSSRCLFQAQCAQPVPGPLQRGDAAPCAPVSVCQY